VDGQVSCPLILETFGEITGPHLHSTVQVNIKSNGVRKYNKKLRRNGSVILL